MRNGLIFVLKDLIIKSLCSVVSLLNWCILQYPAPYWHHLRGQNFGTRFDLPRVIVIPWAMCCVQVMDGKVSIFGFIKGCPLCSTHNSYSLSTTMTPCYNCITHVAMDCWEVWILQHSFRQTLLKMHLSVRRLKY